jgi:hypothetical protein
VTKNLKTKAALPETTVYSYYMPEVRNVVDAVAKDFPHHLLRSNYDPGLDNHHAPFLDSYEAYFADQIRGFDNFAWRYFTAGSSEGLFHLLQNEAVTRHYAEPWYQLQGEYQGYEAYADAVGRTIWSVQPDEVRGAPPGLFVVSNPSAIDGNALDAGLWHDIVTNHRVILDVAYLGMTEALQIDLGHPNIEAVVASMSKPFGLYYFRIGACWTKTEVPSLFGNRWFKNLFSIEVGKEVLLSLDIRRLREKYQGIQELAIEQAGLDGYDIRPSDVWLLGYARGHGDDDRFVRGKDRRYCLTPYFMLHEDLT